MLRIESIALVTNLYTLSSVSRTLDRERQHLHEIRVEAFDLGVPTSLSSDLDITVYVSDVNDNKYGHQLHFYFFIFSQEKEKMNSILKKIAIVTIFE